MNKLTVTSAVFMALATTGVCAHHMSDGVSPMFDEVTLQLEAVSSPHLDIELDVDSIGYADGMLSGTATRETSDLQARQTQPGEAERVQEVERAEGGPPFDTMGLLEDVENAP